MFFYNTKVVISNILNRILSKYPYKILNTEESLNYIIENNCSVSRFGEGEIRMMKAGVDIGFQKTEVSLVWRLKQIIKSNTECMIAIPYPLVDFSHMNEYGKNFWENHLSYAYLMYFRYMNKNRVYLDSLMTRFYIDIENKNDSQKYISLWRKVWNKRDIVFVEGNQTRLGVGNDFFSNANSIERIECPAENAWYSYQQILEKCKKIEKTKLVLIALGPTASVLAYDLANLGYQAIDIGHLDIEYEWFLMNASEPIAVNHKYTNEAVNGTNVEDIYDSEYLSQIIAHIGTEK